MIAGTGLNYIPAVPPGLAHRCAHSRCTIIQPPRITGGFPSPLLSACAVRFALGSPFIPASCAAIPPPAALLPFRLRTTRLPQWFSSLYRLPETLSIGFGGKTGKIQQAMLRFTHPNPSKKLLTTPAHFGIMRVSQRKGTRLLARERELWVGGTQPGGWRRSPRSDLIERLTGAPVTAPTRGCL